MTAPSKPLAAPVRRPDAQREDAMIVDRLLKKLRYADPDLSRDRSRPTRPHAPRMTPGPIVGRAAREPSWHRPWLWAVLGVILGLGLTQWPYVRTCGGPLFGYLGAVSTLLLTGTLGGVSAWRNRRGVAHVLALLVVLGGLVLVADVVLPRAGYAGASAAWLCGE